MKVIKFIGTTFFVIVVTCIIAFLMSLIAKTIVPGCSWWFWKWNLLFAILYCLSLLGVIFVYSIIARNMIFAPKDDPRDYMVVGGRYSKGDNQC